MIIRQVHLERFGCHDRLDLEFRPGLNIIRGPNSSGKSTLQRALLKLLFDRPNKSVANAKELAWGAERLYRLALKFEVDSQGAYRLNKDFETSECRLALGTGEELTDFRAVGAELTRLVGTASAKLFKSTLFVAQQELAKLGETKEINTSLEERVTGGEDDTSTQKVLDRLQKAIDAYGKGHGPNVRANAKLGVIAQTQKEIGELNASIDSLRKGLDAQMRDLAERDQVEQRLEECRKELNSNRDILASLGKVNRLKEQLQEAEADERRLEERIESIKKAQTVLAEANQAVAALKPVSDVDSAQHQALLTMQTKLRLLRDEPLPSAPEGLQPRQPRRPWLAIGLMALGVVGVTVSVIWGRLFDPFITLVALALGVLLLVSGALWWLVHSSRQRQ